MYDTNNLFQLEQQVSQLPDPLLKQMIQSVPRDDPRWDVVATELRNRQELRSRTENRKALLAQQEQQGIAAAAPADVAQGPQGGLATLAAAEGGEIEDDVPRYNGDTGSLIGGATNADREEFLRWVSSLFQGANRGKPTGRTAGNVAAPPPVVEGVYPEPNRVRNAPPAPPAPPPAPPAGAPPRAAVAAAAAPATVGIDALLKQMDKATAAQSDPFLRERAALASAREKAAEESRADAAGLFAAREKQYAEREGRLRGEEAQLEKRGNDEKAFAFIKAGVAMATMPGPAMAAAARGLGVGVDSYRTGVEKIEAARKELRTAYDKLEDSRYGTQADRVNAEKAFRDAKLSAHETYLSGIENAYKVSRQTAEKLVVLNAEQTGQNARTAATNATQLQVAQMREEGERKRLEQGMNSADARERAATQQYLLGIYKEALEQWEKNRASITAGSKIQTFDDYLLSRNIPTDLLRLAVERVRSAGAAPGAAAAPGVTVTGLSKPQTK